MDAYCLNHQSSLLASTKIITFQENWVKYQEDTKGLNSVSRKNYTEAQMPALSTKIWTKVRTKKQL